jgi:hypothetical protein
MIFVLVAGCGSDELSCGEGLDPHIVTGLSGVLDDGTPAVEVQLRVPMDCSVLDTTWMFWDDANETVTLGEAPTSGTLDRQDVEAGDFIIAFSELNLGVRLDYPDGVVGPEIGLAWFSAGVDLAHVDCSGAEEALACQVRAP